ncbi:tyrosine-type recombinase/integrase [Streptococcus pneumoniae]|uniref:Tyrosine-type recombinase/integrase n=1 Tax=Streptococcus pneumoniae TaxID=1313 RepID=A0A4K0UAZ4_STREE|nr:tyrosine-type recombinase/integrase [Streptococcus pneumoniae]EHD55253.1 phage integrase family protein [Streptococcus pneumoniae NP070]EHZ15391.1 phage integrase family protein [Streptococcus pneumoniae GA13224]EJG49422.1 phage integrase family protein [Streptococcus pneumoniae 2070768]EHZ58857.1 phage integrase family protein [Streptococcus pneumoniae GA47461]EJG34228.1 phage integrase family protein [Streptococcus pneumoniae 2070005]
MAYIEYKQRGKKRLWSFSIRERSKSLLHKSGFKTKREAKIEAEKVLHKLNTGSVLSSSMTLSELYNEWLDLKILPSNRSVVTKKKYLMRKKVIERLFGNKPVSQIKPSEYQKIMNEYGETVSRNFLGRLNSCIRASIQMAIADKVIIEDFTAYVELFSSKSGQKVEEKYLHAESDYQKVLVYLKNKFDYQKSIVPYVIYFLFKTGMRFSELIALTWDEVDELNEQLKTYRRYNTAIHKFTPPKNNTSIRLVPITSDMLSLLKTLKILQLKTNKELNIDNENNLIFQHFGYVYDVPDIATVNKAIKVMLKELQIFPLITTKGARHTYGSYLWHNNIDLGVIAKILGHKDISMLIDVYGHTLEEKISEEFMAVKSLL